MADKNKTIFAEVEFGDILFCPHCGQKLFSFTDGFMGKCAHLVYAYGWGDPNSFLSVRCDYAKDFLKALLASDEYKQSQIEDELDPIGDDDQHLFSTACFKPFDRIATMVASFCLGFPESMFPSLFSESTVIFKDDRYYSGVHIAIDLGSTG